MKNFKPYQQGKLDNLCGIYAIVNAIRWGNLKSPRVRFSFDECEALVQEMISCLEGQDRLYSTLKEGLMIPDMSFLLKATTKWLLENKDIAQVTDKPFHSASDLPMSSLTDKVNSHLSTPKSSAILVTTGDLDHWTVPIKVNLTRLNFADSYGIPSIKTKDCSCSAFSVQSSKKYKIIPSGLFLLSFSGTN